MRADVPSGLGVEQFGYAGFFILTFLLSFPAYALLPWVRRWVGNGNGQSVDATAGEQAPAHRPKPASATAP